jgi:hypothetical protein
MKMGVNMAVKFQNRRKKRMSSSSSSRKLAVAAMPVYHSSS